MEKDKTGFIYICQECGYEALKMGELSECPLCRLCARCGKPVRVCVCIESE